MHPADIKAAIQKAGSSQVLIAQRVKKPGDTHVHKTAVCRVIAGTLKSQHIAKAVAEVTKIPVSLLWPGRYPELEIIAAAAALAAPNDGGKTTPALPTRRVKRSTPRRKA